MVKLEQLDQNYDKVFIEEEDDYLSDEDFEDEEEIEENLWERIQALQDIIPVKQRRAFKDSISTLTSYAGSALSLVGKSAWVLSTSAFVVFLPLAFLIERNDEQTRAIKDMPQDQSSVEAVPSSL